MNAQTFESNYKIFASFIGDKVLCNNIANIDSSVYDNARFDWIKTDEEGNEREIEVCQWFILGAQEWEIELAQKDFPEALFTYSDMLDCFILCVDHWGTSWESVPMKTTEQCFEIGGPWDK